MAKIVTFGELLLRLSPPDNHTILQTSSFNSWFGGAEANVAVALSQWGHEVKFVTRLPKNDIALAALSSLKKYGVNVEDVQFGGERMGIYFLQGGIGGRSPEVTYDRAHSSIATILPGMLNWKKILEGADIFHWSGISAAISESTAMVCKEAILTAVDLGLIVTVDLNFRSKLWKYGQHPSKVLPSLVEHCDIIFGGIDAPEHYFNIIPNGKINTKGTLSEEDITSICTQVLERFPKAQYFSSTLRDVINASHHKLQGIIYNRQVLLRSPTYDMPYLVDRVGGGDAFMAGLIHIFLNDRGDLKKAVDFSAASSYLKHFITGDFPHSPEEKIIEIMQGNSYAIGR